MSVHRPGLDLAPRLLRRMTISEWFSQAVEYTRAQHWAEDAHPYAIDILVRVLGVETPLNQFRTEPVSGWKNSQHAMTGAYAPNRSEEFIELLGNEGAPARQFGRAIFYLWETTGGVALDEWCATHDPVELAMLFTDAAITARQWGE